MGRFTGEAPGLAFLSIDAGNSHKPYVCMVQNLDEPLATRVVFNATYAADSFIAESESIKVFDGRTNQLIDSNEFLRRTGHQYKMAGKISIKGSYTAYTFRGEWDSDTLGGGTFELLNPAMNLVGQPDHFLSWREYKDFLNRALPNIEKVVFRGQASNQWRLRTSFHRENRYDLGWYWSIVCPALVSRFKTDGINYDLAKPEDIGSLLCFAQHHGFPTPLLDWTKDPYVAAYFAFEKGPTVVSPNNSCRIYILNKTDWTQDTNNGASLADPNPLVSFREFDSKHIPRQVRQKCLHTFTNIEDIESWIRLYESQKQKKYLTTVDIPWSERNLAKPDLRQMNITADELFLDRDAMCKTLKEGLF